VAIIRHTGLNLRSRAKPTVSLKNRRKRAGWNVDYLETVIRHTAMFKRFAWPGWSRRLTEWLIEASSYILRWQVGSHEGWKHEGSLVNESLSKQA
jgi:hypothetical protein